MWLLISILIVIILLGVVALLVAKKKPEKDYYSLFIIGVVWVPFGIIMMFLEPDYFLGTLFFLLGWCYFVIGILNKDKWKKKSYLIKNKFWRNLIIILLGLGVLVGLVAYMILR